MHMRRTFVVGLACLVILTGCASNPGLDPVTSPKPTQTFTAPSTTPVPSATTPPTTSPALTARAAYRLCTDYVGESATTSKDTFIVVPFEQAETVLRADEYYWVWANYEDSAKPNSGTGAAHCIIGGTLDNPEYIVASEILRSERLHVGPEEPLSNYSD